VVHGRALLEQSSSTLALLDQAPLAICDAALSLLQGRAHVNDRTDQGLLAPRLLQEKDLLAHQFTVGSGSRVDETRGEH
jgi:hypothetical protein